mgnify:CR=1 FL=1
MEIIRTNRIAEIRREKKFLERTFNLKIQITKGTVTIEGSPLDEYEATRVFEAIDLGFSAKTASILKDENFLFEIIRIKDFTRRKNLSVVRSRVIGTKGKTKDTIEQITGCKLKLKGNEIGIIGPADSMQYAITALTNIIRGTKQANAYKYLERINTQRKNKNGIRI